MSRQLFGVGAALGAIVISVLVAVGVGVVPAAAQDREPAQAPPRAPSPVIDPFLVDLQTRTFRFFWETANPQNGLVPDRYPTPSFSSIAAVGFGLTTYPVGVERGYITREQARQRVLATLRFFADAPQGPDAQGKTGYRGFFYHFLDMKTGTRFEDSEVSTVDTAILVAGALFCQSYFDGADPEEVEIRALVKRIYERVDWRWAQPKGPAISLGWSPEEGFLRYDWRGYNEAMLVYLLALGSPTFPVDGDAWAEWTSTYDKQWGTVFGQEFLSFPPLFGHQYTHVWTDLRDIRDPYMQRRGLDYFENSRRAVYAQRAYAIANPRQCRDYGPTVWGITASDGPADVEIEEAGGRRAFRSYAARGARPARPTTAPWRRPRSWRRSPSPPSWPFQPSSTCTVVSGSTSTPSTDSSTRSTERFSSTFPSDTAVTFRTSAGWTSTISASTRGSWSRCSRTTGAGWCGG